MNKILFKVFGAMSRSYIYECFGIGTADQLICKRHKFISKFCAWDNLFILLCRVIYGVLLCYPMFGEIPLYIT